MDYRCCLSGFRLGAQEVEVGFVAESTITTTACDFKQDSGVNEPSYGFGGSGLCCFEQLHSFGHGDNRMSWQ
jgi:hypothetical protein